MVFIYYVYINMNMQTHYEKYKETIKKVARRHYNKRVAWLNNHLSDKSCTNCGESETVCLKFHPHDSEIRKKSKTTAINGTRDEIILLMDDSKILCHNGWIKLDTDLIELL